jgi:multidrug efflux pump subunit AcrB
VQYVNRARAFMPQGTVGPFCMRFDTGSVPVGYLVMSSKTKTIGEIQDQALFKVRPMFASLQGVSAPPPFGGNQRTIVLNVDPQRLRAYNVSPDDVVAALKTGNTISPSGNARIKDQMPIVPTNAMVKDPKELGAIPIRPGANVYLRDLATIEDSTDIPTGYALVDGKRAVYILVTKRADASTLAVVNEVRNNLQRMREQVPPDIDVDFMLDQSPYVTRAMLGVGIEGLLCACLTGLMVLLFLHDWRSVLVVVLNIPLSLLGSIVALWLTGQTLNLMTLSGLALAIGILVDEATVEVENIHTQYEHTPSIARAVRLGNQMTAVPRLLAMLCILAVFIPSFFMQGAARELFVPLSLAVGFAMITSYWLSSTFVPVMSVWLLKHSPVAHAPGSPGLLEKLRRVYARISHGIMPFRYFVVVGYVLVVGLVLWQAGSRLGREIFPNVDAGMFQFRLRAPEGTRIERTEQVAVEALNFIKEEAGPDNIDLSLGYVGLIGSSYPINNIYLWTRGPEEAVLRVALKHGSGVRVEDLKQRLRQKLPQHLADYLRRQYRTDDLTEEQVADRLRTLSVSFEPADIVNEVMSFGSPTPIEVAVSGPNLAETRAYGEKIREQLAKIASLRDLQFVQSLDYPTVDVRIDRERAGLSGLTVADVSKSLVDATSSSRFVEPVFWADPKSGIGYFVQVQVPPYQMNSAAEIGMVSIKGKTDKQLLVRDVADIKEGKQPGEYDRYNMRRVISMTANIEGEDLGRVIGQLNQALEAAGQPPRGVLVDVRGQVVPMQEMFGALGGGLVSPTGTPWGNWSSWQKFLGKFFTGLTGGLIMSFVVILLLLIAYFQSVRLAIASVATVPAVLAGACVTLLLTGTTLNIQSLVGLIMASGVAAANAILLTTFAERLRNEGKPATEAGAEAAQLRLRPLLMTSFAMIAGMLPMALGLGEGGEQTAPLGRAVAGGLVCSMTAKLFVLPSVFAVLMGNTATSSASLDPDDPESTYYDQVDEKRAG